MFVSLALKVVMQNEGDVVDVRLLYLTHMWTFTSYAADFVENQFNRRSQSFAISNLIMRIREDLMTPHTSFSKVTVYGPSSSLKIVSSKYGIRFFTQ
jgi:hypothetical protein